MGEIVVGCHMCAVEFKLVHQRVGDTWNFKFVNQRSMVERFANEITYR